MYRSDPNRAPNLVAGMAWLQSTYTIRLNHRHKLIGHVLSGRYKAQLVEGSGNGYLRTACDYVHLNPVRAGLVKLGNDAFDSIHLAVLRGLGLWSRNGRQQAGGEALHLTGQQADAGGLHGQPGTQ